MVFPEISARTQEAKVVKDSTLPWNVGGAVDRRVLTEFDMEIGSAFEPKMFVA
jgi:hypothetical protein